jgi:hypothetical protein
MKYFLIITLLIFSTLKLYCQQIDFTKLIFETKSNLAITKSLDHKLPSRIYLLSKTISWNPRRFKLNKPSGRHAEATELYIFADTSLRNIFSVNENEHLANQAQTSASEKNSKKYKEIYMIDSFSELRKGFLFAITNPVYTSDSNYVFIDMEIYYKNKEINCMNEAYYGRVLIIYKYTKQFGWILFKKEDNLIL